MNGRSATADQLKDGGEGRLKQKLLQTESTLKILNHKTSLPSVTLSIYVFWVSSNALCTPPTAFTYPIKIRNASNLWSTFLLSVPEFLVILWVAKPEVTSGQSRILPMIQFLQARINQNYCSSGEMGTLSTQSKLVGVSGDGRGRMHSTHTQIWLCNRVIGGGILFITSLIAFG